MDNVDLEIILFVSGTIEENYSGGMPLMYSRKRRGPAQSLIFMTKSGRKANDINGSQSQDQFIYIILANRSKQKLHRSCCKINDAQR